MARTPPAVDESPHALAAIVRGMAVAMLGSILGGGLGFVFLLVMGRTLSVRDFGLLILAVNLLNSGSTLTIAGADYATIRFVSAAQTPGRKRGAMLTPFLLALALNGLLAVVVLVFARPIARDLLDQPAFVGPLRACALVLPLTVAAQMLSAAISGLEQASGELVRKVAEQGARILLAPLAVAAGFGVLGAVFGMAIAAAAATLAVALLLARAIPRGGTLEPIQARAVVGFAWPQTIANGVAQVWWLTTVAFLSRYGGARDVAIFGAASAIARIPALVYNSFAFRFSPTISRLWEEQHREELHELLQSVTRWVAIFALPLFAVAIALPGSLLRVFGGDYGGGATVMVLVALAVMVDSLAGPVDRALIMTGRVTMEMYANVGTSAAMLPVAWVLVERYGLTGAAAAVIAFNSVLNALKIFLVWRTLRMSPLSTTLFGPLAAAMVGVVAAIALARTTSLGDTLPGTALVGLMLLVVYSVLLLRVFGISSADRAALRLAIRAGT